MGNPTFMYRRDKKTGAVAAEVFDSEAIPKGWVDTPAKLDAPAVPDDADDASTDPAA